MDAIFKLAVMALGIFFLWEIGIRIFRKFVRFPTPYFMNFILESGLRQKYQPPSEVIKQTGLKEGMYVLEVGCGSGVYTLEAAKAVGPNGKILATDMQSGMINKLMKKLSRPENIEIKNIETRLATAYDLPFEDNFFDAVFMVTVLHEIPDRKYALREVRRVLKPGGIFSTSEFLADPDYAFRRTTVRLGKDSGFTHEETLGNFFRYTARFRKPTLQ